MGGSPHMELHYAAPTTYSPAIAKLFRTAVRPCVTPRPMLRCATKSRGLSGFVEDFAAESPHAERRL